MQATRRSYLQGLVRDVRQIMEVEMTYKYWICQGVETSDTDFKCEFKCELVNLVYVKPYYHWGLQCNFIYMW